MAFNVWTFLFEVLNFLVLAFILQRFLYRPLHEAIDARRAAITKAQADVEAARKQAEEQQAQLTSRLAAVDEQRRQVLAEAHTQAEAERTRLLASLDQESRTRRDEAREVLERERRDSEEELHGAMVALALDLAARLLGEVCTPDLQRQLARRLIDALSHLTGDDQARVGGTHASADTSATVETAMALDDVTLAEITAAIAALLGSPTPVAVKVRPELLGGLRVLLEGHVWDGSLAGRLEEARHAQTAVPA